jgi:hypothetical protein
MYKLSENTIIIIHTNDGIDKYYQDILFRFYKLGLLKIKPDNITFIHLYVKEQCFPGGDYYMLLTKKKDQNVEQMEYKYILDMFSPITLITDAMNIKIKQIENKSSKPLDLYGDMQKQIAETKQQVSSSEERRKLLEETQEYLKTLYQKQTNHKYLKYKKKYLTLKNNNNF